MVGRVRVAAKFFTLGLLAGLLFAPGSGAETRSRLWRDLAEAVALPVWKGGE